jgi:hypothetical protein
MQIHKQTGLLLTNRANGRGGTGGCGGKDRIALAPSPIAPIAIPAQ